ncbi:olfactory receptor 14C36-like [Anser cygnoides]|uniref:olfactory receptor 14C36-like n=1 Tax=Anser cygnoides TaxID=8845 RepID=UPI0034D17076
MPNISSVSEFLLLAFADTRELQLLHFALFLAIYLAALLGNGLILTAVACDHRLHTPMYFFLLNLAVLDLGCISTTLPKAMANSLWDTRAISYQECASQVLFFIFFFGSEYSILTIMAYDHYVAICKPLHYGSLLGSRACAQIAAAAWGSGFLNAVLHTASTFSLPLCQGNAVEQFFCEIPHILKLSCSDAYLREFELLVFSLSLVFGCFVFIVLSYVQIFRTVLRMPSEQGRHKAFSTCLPHLAVVSLFVSTDMFAYLKPPSISSPSMDLVVTVLYSVVPPAVNPLIYCMRNQELRDANGIADRAGETELTAKGHIRMWKLGPSRDKVRKFPGNVPDLDPRRLCPLPAHHMEVSGPGHSMTALPVLAGCSERMNALGPPSCSSQAS